MAGFGTAGFVGFFDIGAHLDLMWTDPAWGQQVDRFGALWRALFFQMRGIGLSGAVERLVSRHASELFPAGELVVLRPSVPGMSWGESLAVVWEHNTELVSGRATTPSDRLVATVVFEERIGNDLSGLAVLVAARIGAAATQPWQACAHRLPSRD